MIQFFVLFASRLQSNNDELDLQSRTQKVVHAQVPRNIDPLHGGTDLPEDSGRGSKAQATRADNIITRDRIHMGVGR